MRHMNDDSIPGGQKEFNLTINIPDQYNEMQLCNVVSGYGETVAEAEKDAHRRAITVVTEFIQSRSCSEFPLDHNDFNLALLALAQHKAFVEEYSENVRAGYGGVFPQNGYPPFGGELRDYISIDRSHERWTFNGTIVGGYPFSCPAYAYGKTRADARYAYLTKVASMLAVLIRREKNEDRLFDLNEAAAKLTDLLEGAKVDMTDYAKLYRQPLQDVLNPEMSWKTAPQHVAGEVPKEVLDSKKPPC